MRIRRLKLNNLAYLVVKTKINLRRGKIIIFLLSTKDGILKVAKVNSLSVGLP